MPLVAHNRLLSLHGHLGAVLAPAQFVLLRVQ